MNHLNISNIYLSFRGFEQAKSCASGTDDIIANECTAAKSSCLNVQVCILSANLELSRFFLY